MIPSLINLLSFRFVLNTDNFKEFLIKSFLYFSLQRETFYLCLSLATSRKMEKPSSSGIRRWIAVTCHTNAISQQTVSIHQDYLIKIQFPATLLTKLKRYCRSNLHLFCIKYCLIFFVTRFRRKKYSFTRRDTQLLLLVFSFGKQHNLLQRSSSSYVFCITVVISAKLIKCSSKSHKDKQRWRNKTCPFYKHFMHF